MPSADLGAGGRPLQDDEAHTEPAVGMVAPVREQCGVADYTVYLTDELRHLCDLRYVVDPADFTPASGPADIVHIQHQYFLFGGVSPLKNRFSRFIRDVKTPVVMTVHEFVSPSGSPAVRAAIAATNRAQFRQRQVRRLMVHTEADRAKLLDSGVSQERVTVVRHGVPPVPALPPRSEARRALDVEGRFVVTLFGFLSRRKGHSLVLEAVRQIDDSVVVLFAGGRHPDDKTDYVPGLQSAIALGGLADRVRVTGYLSPDEVARVMSATDLIVAPFTEASGSGSLAMAFACGKPILASDIPPHREYLMASPSSVHLAPSGDGDALAQAIRDLQRDASRLSELSEGSRHYALAHSYGRMALETVGVYQAVLSGPS
jgi:glycosyltransferase involved in cell wall biosynthesis